MTFFFVIPAKAGIQVDFEPYMRAARISAFAGMTER